MSNIAIQFALYASRYVVQPVVKMKQAIKSAMYFFVPTHVSEVVHVDTEHNKNNVIHKGFFWTQNYTNNMMLGGSSAENGYYYVKSWDWLRQQECEYFLHASYFKKALGITNISSLWAIHDYGMNILLSEFRLFQPSTNDIFGILSNENEDMTTVLSKLMWSIQLPTNVTAKAVCMLLTYLGHPQTSTTLKVLDYDLKENIVQGDMHLVV